VGRYEIQSLLGAGGMGEVYLARDIKLGRMVALKMLPVAYTSDKDRLNRFNQEALTVSRLNHPNIVTIYEADNEDSKYFIAMELVEGITLQEKIKQGPLSVNDTIEIAIQIASALTAAHEAGIAHRDIKPNNIMVRPDGFIKVLDFGLAKLVQKSLPIDREAPTLPLIVTDPRGRVGTVGYMSPEQAKGIEIDSRSDLWSLGCVIYEMLMGRPAFEGATHREVLAKVVDPLALMPPTEGPDVLKWIVLKALRQNPEERYQTAREMFADLKTLRSDLQAIRIPMPSNAHEPFKSSSEIDPSAAKLKSGPRHSRIPSASLLTTLMKKRWLIISACVIVAALAFSTYYFLKRPSPVKKQPENVPQKTVTHLITGYGARNPSISRDGKKVAYVDWRDNKANLWVREISQGISSRIVEFRVEEPQFFGTAFAPDASVVYYVMVHKQDQKGTLYKVPVVGGRDPQIVRHNVSSPITLSPDGTEFAFFEYDPSGENKLLTSKIDDSLEPVVRKSRKSEDAVWSVAWSPDGKTLAFIANSQTDCCSKTIVELRLDTGEERRLTTKTWTGDIGQLCWLSDGSALLLAATERRGGRSQIWYVSHADGKTRNIVNDLTDYGPGLSISADSSTLVADIIDSSYSISILDKSVSHWITSGRYDGIGGAAWTPDGHVVYVTQTNSNYDICIMNHDGTNSKLLLSDRALSWETEVSPDGRYVVFSSDREGTGIWRMDADGSHLKRLTDALDFSPSFSPDSKWVFFNKLRGGRVTIWKISINGGQQTQLSERYLYVHTLSPDGEWTSCMMIDEANKSAKPVLLSVTDGRLKELKAPIGASPPVWWHNGREYLYAIRDQQGDTFWTQPVGGGKLSRIAWFPSETVETYDVGRDDRLLLTHRNASSEIALIKNFKP
jgi:serine/threonine protein kinase